MAEFPEAVKNLVAAFERLPGIGPKSATRLVFYLLNTPQSFVNDFSNLLLEFKKKIKICKKCFSISEQDVCSICSDPTRNNGIICVVEKAIDVMAIENMGGYKGVYHVLGGVINPLDHIGPDDLKIDELIMRIQNPPDDLEIILATNPTMEGEGTALYIKKQLEGLTQGSTHTLKITRIGSGLPMGADLEFADQATLNRAMEGRRAI